MAFDAKTTKEDMERMWTFIFEEKLKARHFLTVAKKHGLWDVVRLVGVDSQESLNGTHVFAGGHQRMLKCMAHFEFSPNNALFGLVINIMPPVWLG